MLSVGMPTIARATSDFACEMPQSLAHLHIHLVFSTKDRVALIPDGGIRDRLHACMASALQGLRCAPVLINSVEDHVHLLFDLARTVSVSQVVQEVKVSSSKWMKEADPSLASFSWQSGYGAFGVSASNVEAVRNYIARQREHHRKTAFKEEFRKFLDKHGIACDERYVWD